MDIKPDTFNNARIFRAISFAAIAHDGSYKDGRPFICHPFGVAHLLQSIDSSEDLIIAGYLHDVIESTMYKLEDIKYEFGDNVAELVDYVTEDKSMNENEDEWKQRKIRAIKKVENGPLEAALLRWADKTHTLVNILDDYKSKNNSEFLDYGNAWNKFFAKKERQLWYYSKISELVNHRFNGTEYAKLAEYFDALIQKLESKLNSNNN
ncbi:MAG: HD domain-containing protein [Methanohalobium sp.]|uniref:HD domain-containing protein n=1 Tax=Methanohalobium sp. TaxID=2837493 RepID=UPI0039782E3E